jgi:LmbE family N-acetylglucosaminyl deacetylase
MKVIVVSPHPDDLEIACGGTLKRLHDEGAQIISIITVKPSAEVNSARSQEIVTQELADSYALSTFDLRMLDTPLHSNGRPNLVCDNVTMTALADLFESCDLAILPNPQDYHQDHKNTYNLAWPIALKYAKEIWLAHSIPYCFQYSTNTANLFYNISDHWDFKKKLLKCYHSYINVDFVNKIHAANMYWGAQSNAELAEAFTIVKKNV